jgi:hypothetical protein
LEYAWVIRKKQYNKNNNKNPQKNKTKPDSGRRLQKTTYYFQTVAVPKQANLKQTYEDPAK